MPKKISNEVLQQAQELPEIGLIIVKNNATGWNTYEVL